jgi:type I restriction enzyme S subunit
MPNIHFERFDKLLKFLPKSKIKAGDGQESGKYPFFKSGNDQSKFIDTAIFQGESLIIGDGGSANINFYDKKFSASDHCYVIQKNTQDIDIKYVYYYLKSNLQILETGFKGAGLKNISKKYISEIKIPLLPLQDQQKIAQLLTQIEELINKREESSNYLMSL